MKKIIILLILTASLTGCYSSGMVYDPVETGSTYLVVKQNMSVSSPWVRNFSLPKTVTSYIMSGFTYYDGTVKMNNDYKLSNAYRGNRKLEDINGYTVYEIPFTEDFKDMVERQIITGMDMYEISFSISDLLNNKNELLYQPAGIALIKGITKSKKPSGQACLLELRYAGSGRFQARVGVRQL
jgi:hypothetical protein